MAMRQCSVYAGEEFFKYTTAFSTNPSGKPHLVYQAATQWV